MEFTLFMLFSIIENICFFAITFALYRIKPRGFYLPVLAICIIIDLLSFVLRKEVHLADYTPLAILVLLILFMMVVIRLPVFWAVVVSLTGYFALFMLQAAILLLSFGFLSPDEMGKHEWKGYLLQTLTGVLGILIGKFLYRRGLGFAFMFDKLQMRLSLVGLIAIIVVLTVGFGMILFLNNLYEATGIIILGLAFFLYYALRREKQESAEFSMD